MARLFVAVRPPSGVLHLLDSLERPDESGVRWVPREQWHVTLRFLGAADPDQVAAALDSAELSRVTAELGPAVTRLGRGVVCVPVHGLGDLAADVVSATASLGDPPDPRPFHGHMTLARLRNRARCAMTGVRVSAAWDVDEVELVDSTLTDKGAIHRVVSRRSL